MRRPRVLLTGRFTLPGAGATAADLLAVDAVARWLRELVIDHQVALAPDLHGARVDGRADAVRLDAVDPQDHTHLLHVGGPVEGPAVTELLEHFAGCTTVALGGSVSAGSAAFDVVLGRDGGDTDRPDLVLAFAPDPLPPVVALVRDGDPLEERVARVVEEALRDHEVAVVEVDPRVDPHSVVGRRSCDVEAALARADAVVTTSVVGVVLALRRGVPVVAIDATGGGPVAHQAAVLDWPGVLVLGADEDLDGFAERLGDCLGWVLGPDAAVAARRVARRTQAPLEALRREVADVLER